MHWACRDNFEEGKPAKIRKLNEDAAEQLAVRKLVEEQVVLQAAVRRLGATCKARAKTTAKPPRTTVWKQEVKKYFKHAAVVV